jgi:hypothetical protein
MMSIVTFSSLGERFQTGSAIRTLGLRYPSVHLQFQMVNSFGCLFLLFMHLIKNKIWIAYSYIPYLVIKNKTRGNKVYILAMNILFDYDMTGEDSFFHPKKEDHFFLLLTKPIRNKYELESGVIFYELVMESGDEIEVSIRLGPGCSVKKCGVHLLVAEPNVM